MWSYLEITISNFFYLKFLFVWLVKTILNTLYQRGWNQHQERNLLGKKNLGLHGLEFFIGFTTRPRLYISGWMMRPVLIVKLCKFGDYFATSLMSKLASDECRYRIGGYRTAAFYLFLRILGCSQWLFFPIFIQKYSYLEQKFVKSNHCVAKLCLMVF